MIDYSTRNYIFSFAQDKVILSVGIVSDCPTSEIKRYNGYETRIADCQGNLKFASIQNSLDWFCSTDGAKSPGSQNCLAKNCLLPHHQHLYPNPQVSLNNWVTLFFCSKFDFAAGLSKIPDQNMLLVDSP